MDYAAKKMAEVLADADTFDRRLSDLVPEVRKIHRELHDLMLDQFPYEGSEPVNVFGEEEWVGMMHKRLDQLYSAIRWLNY